MSIGNRGQPTAIDEPPTEEPRNGSGELLTISVALQRAGPRSCDRSHGSTTKGCTLFGGREAMIPQRPVQHRARRLASRKGMASAAAERNGGVNDSDRPSFRIRGGASSSLRAVERRADRDTLSRRRGSVHRPTLAAQWGPAYAEASAGNHFAPPSRPTDRNSHEFRYIGWP